MQSIRARRAVTPAGEVNEAIIGISPPSIEICDRQSSAPPDSPHFELVLPGFVDLQVNGAMGVDFAAMDDGRWADVDRHLLSTGVTSFLATLTSAHPRRLAASTERLLAKPTSAPRLLGVHLEGPLLNPDFAGAHDREAIEAARADELADLVDRFDDGIVMVTVAPEREGVLELIGHLVQRGVLVSLGHTAAGPSLIEQAVEAGARSVTHLFNAQPPIASRRPGPALAGLTYPGLACSLILDFEHLDRDLGGFALSALGERAYLITDATAGAGMPPGEYRLGNRSITVEAGAPRDETGRLAGSVLTMDGAFRNAITSGLSVPHATRACSTLPAELLGRSDLGGIEPGRPADLLALDGSLQPVATWVAGELTWAQTNGQG